MNYNKGKEWNRGGRMTGGRRSEKRFDENDGGQDGVRRIRARYTMTPSSPTESERRRRFRRSNEDVRGQERRDRGEGSRGYGRGFDREERGGRPYRRRSENYSGDGGRWGSARRSEESGYDPNAKYSKKKQLEYKQKKQSPNDPIRLNRFLANAGICSRREADEYIKAGVVSVNGEVVTELGTKVVPAKDKIMFHDQPVRSQKLVYILMNKPKDCVTTTDDPQARITVMDIVKDACPERVYPVGRLDRNTTGVLLLTNDGDLAMKLTHPRYEHRKIYQVGLDRVVSASDMEKILNGIELDDGPIAADDISYDDVSDRSVVGIEIHSGRNRIVRRIFESLGYKVMRLDRVYFAGLTKKNVPRGKFRFLTDKEVGFLKMSTNGMASKVSEND